MGVGAKFVAGSDAGVEPTVSNIEVIPASDKRNMFEEDLLRYRNVSDEDDYVVKRSSDGSVVTRKSDSRFYIANRNLLSDEYLLQVAVFAKETSEVADILIPERLSNENRIVFFNKMNAALLKAGFSPDDIAPKEVPKRESSLKMARSADESGVDLNTKDDAELDLSEAENALNSYTGDDFHKVAAGAILATVKGFDHPFTLSEFAKKLNETNSSVRVSVQKNMAGNSSDNFSLSYLVSDGNGFNKFVTGNNLCLANGEIKGCFGVNSKCFAGCTFDPKISEINLMKMAIDEIKNDIAKAGGVDCRSVQYSDVYSYIKKGVGNRHKTNVFRRSLLASAFNIIPKSQGRGDASSAINLYNCKAKYRLSELMSEPDLPKNKMAGDLLKAASFKQSNDGAKRNGGVGAIKTAKSDQSNSPKDKIVPANGADGVAVNCEATLQSGIHYNN